MIKVFLLRIFLTGILRRKKDLVNQALLDLREIKESNECLKPDLRSYNSETFNSKGGGVQIVIFVI